MRPGLYQIWNDGKNKILGDVERFTTHLGKTSYRSTLLNDKEVERVFDDIFEALKWTYDNTKEN